ncbi:hypothetical protein EHW71_08435 (plasmid) [Clostridium butyricum]|nr:hypothetical protein EHW71_08435 [Clostridium butyricum]
MFPLQGPIPLPVPIPFPSGPVPSLLGITIPPYYIISFGHLPFTIIILNSWHMSITFYGNFIKN